MRWSIKLSGFWLFRVVHPQCACVVSHFMLYTLSPFALVIYLMVEDDLITLYVDNMYTYPLLVGSVLRTDR